MLTPGCNDGNELSTFIENLLLSPSLPDHLLREHKRTPYQLSRNAVTKNAMPAHHIWCLLVMHEAELLLLGGSYLQ